MIDLDCSGGGRGGSVGLTALGKLQQPTTRTYKWYDDDV
jgi:hypothetical protein